jgi:hypothetical protein
MMLQPSDFSRLERQILDSCHLNEWHPNAWFPSPKRYSLNLPDGPTDEAILEALVSLIRRGFVQLGRLSDDGHFLPEPSPSEEIITDRVNNQETEFFISTRDDVYQVIKNTR